MAIYCLTMTIFSQAKSKSVYLIFGAENVYKKYASIYSVHT